MDSQLFTLSKIFTERLFRIPDYQRGYAWTEAQWKDFWNDIRQIDEGSNHYTGVLTLEIVPEADRKGWSDDIWIIESKSFEPFYVVDGQQRLTTAIILIQVIIERCGDNASLNYNTIPDIRKKFIFDSKDLGISRSYIFGYDKDNPSYEFLKTNIFQEFSSTDLAEETIYTNNLETAKRFFAEKIFNLTISELEALYRKITQSLLFNIFTISEDVDVCVAFETMNNRGKPLSYLELLKNRLIYLSLKLSEPEYEKQKLRVSINDCWKAIYHSLGRNKNKPLDDDLFLGTHYLLYFIKIADQRRVLGEEIDFDIVELDSRPFRKRDHYVKLLQEVFVQKRIQPSDDSVKLELSEIYKYVQSLQVAVNSWYYIFNPESINSNEQSSIWLSKLLRIGSRNYLALILSVMLKIEKDSDRVMIFRALERHIFVTGLIGNSFYYPESYIGFLKEAVSLYRGMTSAKHVAGVINEMTSMMVDSGRFDVDMKAYFKSKGYYNWNHIRYFLYEYNLEMQERSKTERRKIHWSELNDRQSDHVTVEHIYPQNARALYWTTNFSGFTAKQRESLKNSLGNLVPLSQPKNSSLSNRPFPEKVEGKKDAVIGFRFGCYAEIEVAKEQHWTPERIKMRGLKMLSFLEKRWSLRLGSDADKIEMLNLDFLEV